MFRKILAGNDGSDGAFKAFAAAIKLANLHKAELHMVCVEEIPRFATSVDEVVENIADAEYGFAQIIANAKTQAEASGLQLIMHVRRGHAVTAIAELVEREGFDLLVIGFVGHSALYNRLIGSTTDRLVEHAACDVLVVK
jgi:nucleotide-binding universal stress UspA family protein